MNNSNGFKFLIFISLVISSLTTLAKDRPVEKPTAAETNVFRDYFQKSGFLFSGHKIKSLKPGPAFSVIHKACRDQDDLYFLSFDDGIDLELPAGQSMSEFYPSGTGGSVSFVFKHNPAQKYFQFLGRGIYRWPQLAYRGWQSDYAEKEALCPRIKVAVHGSHCKKAGAEECYGTLEYSTYDGYLLKSP